MSTAAMSELNNRRNQLKIKGFSALDMLVTLSVIGLLLYFLGQRFNPLAARIATISFEQKAQQFSEGVRFANLQWQTQNRNSKIFVQGTVESRLANRSEPNSTSMWFVIMDSETGYPVSGGTVTKNGAREELTAVASANSHSMLSTTTLNAEHCRLLLMAILDFRNKAAVSTSFADVEKASFFATAEKSATENICVFYQTRTLHGLLEPPEGDDYREVGNNFVYNPSNGSVNVNLNRSLTTTGL